MKKLAIKDPLFSKVTSVRMAMPNVYLWEARKQPVEAITPDDAHTLLNILFALIQEAHPDSKRPGGASNKLQHLADSSASVKPVIDSLIFFGAQAPCFLKALEKKAGTRMHQPKIPPAIEILHRDTLRNFWNTIDEAKQSSNNNQKLMGLALETAMGLLAAEACA